MSGSIISTRQDISNEDKLGGKMNIDNLPKKESCLSQEKKIVTGQDRQGPF